MKKTIVFLLLISLFSLLVDGDKYLIVCPKADMAQCEELLAAEQPEPPCQSHCGKIFAEENCHAAELQSEQSCQEKLSDEEVCSDIHNVIDLEKCLEKCCPGRLHIPEQPLMFKEAQTFAVKNLINQKSTIIEFSNLQQPLFFHPNSSNSYSIHPIIATTVMLC